MVQARYWDCMCTCQASFALLMRCLFPSLDWRGANFQGCKEIAHRTKLLTKECAASHHQGQAEVLQVLPLAFLILTLEVHRSYYPAMYHKRISEIWG